MNIIQIFSQIRDVPYRIPLSRNDADDCCNGKTIKLKKMFEEAGYEARYAVCEFCWSDLDLPKEILDIPHQDLSTHVYLEANIDGNWVILDPSWDKGLSGILPVNNWNGRSDTTIAVKPTKVYDPEKSAEIMAESEKGQGLEGELNVSGGFFKAFNEYLEKNRRQCNNA
jgi:hypothetical protein